MRHGPPCRGGERGLIITDEQRRIALERLNREADQGNGVSIVLRAMLADPRLPEEPTPKLIEAMRKSNPVLSYRALRAELLGPSPGHVVQWTKDGQQTEVALDTMDEALEYARRLLRQGATVSVSPRSAP